MNTCSSSSWSLWKEAITTIVLPTLAHLFLLSLLIVIPASNSVNPINRVIPMSTLYLLSLPNT
jgi:hypothetical protein